MTRYVPFAHEKEKEIRSTEIKIKMKNLRPKKVTTIKQRRKPKEMREFYNKVYIKRNV